MEKVNKRLLGFGGLAFVAAMTTIAYQLPVSAIGAGGSTEVIVEVYSSTTETIITSPLDGAVFSDPVVSFAESHSHAKSVKYVLEQLDENGEVAQSWELTEYEVSAEDASGTTEFTLDLNDYGGFGTYVFSSEATSPNGTTFTDHASFTYAAISVEQSSVESSAAEVKFRVNYTRGVQSVTYQILDEKGNPVSDLFKMNTSNSGTGGYDDITIDLKDFDLASGKYTISVVGYTLADGEGQTVGYAAVTFDVVATPNVPDTGALFASLNIARADYLITGIIGFTAVSLAALYIIRKNHRNK